MSSLRFARLSAGVRALALLLPVAPAFAQTGAVQPGTVEDQLFIGEGHGGFTGDLIRWDSFGHSVTDIGDLDFDGVNDIIVGCPNFMPEPVAGGLSFSSIYVMFLNPDGTVREHKRITEGQNGFMGDLSSMGHFGSSVAPIGDLDGDGFMDIVVGEQSGDGFPPAFGAGSLWVLYLLPDGTVKKKFRKISFDVAGMFAPLRHGDNFGVSVVPLGDIDGDGVVDLAVGASGDDGPAIGASNVNMGAVYILFLNPDGSVKMTSKITMGTAGFAGPLAPGDFFGMSLARVPGIAGDSIPALLVGAPGDDDGGPNRGAVWRLHLSPTGDVLFQTKVSSTSGGLGTPLADYDSFGRSLSGLGDLDGDGNPQMVVGAPGEDNFNENEGSLHVLFLNAAGDVAAEQKVSSADGDFNQPSPTEAPLRASALAFVNDLNDDGVDELVVGTIPTSPSGEDHGAVWMLFVDGEPVIAPIGLTACGAGRLSVNNDHTPVGGFIDLGVVGAPKHIAPGALTLVQARPAEAFNPCSPPLLDVTSHMTPTGRWFGPGTSARPSFRLPAVASLVDVPVHLGAWLLGENVGATNSVRVLPSAH